jgi:hypothetical protein
MRLIRRITNYEVINDIDVYLDGKLLDRLNYYTHVADDKTGQVEPAHV